MCFAGGSSYSGYGMLGFDRRVRVFEISDFGETIKTWKILDGSGAGSRQDGSFASAIASSDTSASHEDAQPAKAAEEEQPPDEEAYAEQIDESIAELEAVEEATK